MRFRRFKFIMCACILMFVYYFFGVYDYMFAKDFDKEFEYPINFDIRTLAEDIISGLPRNIPPINFYPYRFLSNSGTCSTLNKLNLFIIVKSAMKNFKHRKAIRSTYGQENVVPGKIVKTLFFLGIDKSPKSDIQEKISKEMAEYKDIIQMDFHDSYFNNTIKTVMSFRWVFEHCSNADFYFFTDDDMYISVANLLNYIKTETESEEKLTSVNWDSGLASPSIRSNGKDIYAGYLFKSAPLRYRASKWRVSLAEYPYNKWPPYVTAGAYVLSNKYMKLMYVGSLFVKHFRFDDIYLGIVAKKLGIEPKHCSQFYFYRKSYSKEDYKSVIASHGFDDPEELVKVWKEQNS